MEWNPDWIYWGLLIIFIPITVSHMATEIGKAWMEHRSRSQALDVLRVYAQKGEEPSASVTQAIIAVGSSRTPGFGPWPAPGAGAGAGAGCPPTRAHHMARLATNIVAVVGWVGIAWWRMPADGEPTGLVTFSVIAAIFFTGLVVAHLVGVLTTRNDGGRPRDAR